MDSRYFREDLLSYTTTGGPAFNLPADFTTQDTLGVQNAAYSDFQDHLSRFTLMHDAFSFENVSALHTVGEPPAPLLNVQDIPDPTVFHANLDDYLSAFHPMHAPFPLNNINIQQPNPDPLPGGNVDLQSTIDDISNRFQGHMDAAINSIPSDSEF